MNDHTKKMIRKQIQTHNPLWISEVFNACTNKEMALLKISWIYDHIRQNHPHHIDMHTYKSQVFAFLHPNKDIQTYDFYTCLNDTSHAIMMSEDEHLCFCHQSFWLHIKNQIQETKLHDYDKLFSHLQTRYLFEDWLYEVDIDLHFLNEVSSLLRILQEIKELIDFSYHQDIFDDIVDMENECLDILHYTTIAC